MMPRVGIGAAAGLVLQCQVNLISATGGHFVAWKEGSVAFDHRESLVSIFDVDGPAFKSPLHFPKDVALGPFFNNRFKG